MVRRLMVVVLSLTLLSSGCSSKWVNVALADLPIATNLALQVAAMVDPGADKEIQEYANEAAVDLRLVLQLVDEYNKSKSATTSAKITQLLNEVSSHFTSIITAVHVKNTTKAAHIEQAVQLALVFVTTVVQLLANSKVAGKLPTPDQLQTALVDLQRQV